VEPVRDAGVGEALARREALALAEELEPLLAHVARHEPVEHRRVLRRQPEAVQEIVQEKGPVRVSDGSPRPTCAWTATR
jgi:hypothetical protein